MCACFGINFWHEWFAQLILIRDDNVPLVLVEILAWIFVCFSPANSPMVSTCNNSASKLCETAQLSPCLFWVSLSMLVCSNDAWRQRYINYRPVAKISRRGFMGPSMGVVGCRRGSSENATFLESLRMALAHHKYVLLLPSDVIHIMNAPRPSPSSASVNLGGPGNEADCVTFHRL